MCIRDRPKGIPVGTLAIGEDGAINAALLAASIIANTNPVIKKNLNNLRSVSYTHLRAHETGRNLVCRLLLEKKKYKHDTTTTPPTNT